MKIWRLAWRNLWRNRRRTLVSIAAMGFALLVMVLYAGLLEGYLQGMERSVLDLEVGDLQVFSDAYRDEPSIWERIEHPAELLARLDAAGFRSSARLLAFGLGAAGDASAGVSFRGIEVGRDAQVSRVDEQVAQGEWLDPADPRAVVIGRQLARTLALEPGAEILVLSQAGDGSTAFELFEVRGVLRGISAATDRTAVFMTAPAFRDFLVLPEGAHQIIVRRPPDLDLDSAAAAIRGFAPTLDVKTWRQLMPTIASLMDSARGVMIAMFFIIYAAVGILILNAMLMAVFERVRELGVLKALGASPFDVGRIILAECAIQVAIATVVGLGLAVPGVLYLERTGIDLGALAGTAIIGIAMEPVWYAAVNLEVFLAPVAALVVIVGVAVLYPAAKAAWIQPLQAIHHR